MEVLSSSSTSAPVGADSPECWDEGVAEVSLTSLLSCIVRLVEAALFFWVEVFLWVVGTANGDLFAVSVVERTEEDLDAVGAAAALVVVVVEEVALEGNVSFGRGVAVLADDLGIRMAGRDFAELELVPEDFEVGGPDRVSRTAKAVEVLAAIFRG